MSLRTRGAWVGGMFRVGGMSLAAVLGAVLAAAGAAQPHRPDAPPISNYWEHLNEQLEKYEIAARAQRPGAYSHQIRTFAFEAVQHLTPNELIRAAKEGVEAARRENRGKPPEVIERQARANLTRALEFYPMVAGPDESVRPFFTTIGRSTADPVFRLFLLEQLDTTATAPTQFGLYLRDYAAEERERNYRSLLVPIEVPGESPRVYRAALGALYSLYVAELVELLENDPAIAAWAETPGNTISPGILRDGVGPEVSTRTREAAQRVIARFQALVQTLGQHLRTPDARPAAIRRAARAHIARILATIPLPNPAAAEAILAEHPPESLASN